MDWADGEMRQVHKTSFSAKDLLSGQEQMEQIRKEQRVFVGNEEALRHSRSFGQRF